jgi:DNA-binding LacI/PurR family transcriptional regulator
VDGLLLLGGHANETRTNADYVRLLKKIISPTPIVIINGKLDNYSENYASVSSDEYQAMFQALDYLTGLGHKKIAFLGGITGIMSTDIKIKALMDAKKKYDYLMKNQWIIHSNYSYLGGVEAMNKLLLLKDLPTAIIAVNDEVAAGAINTCISRGYHVPDDFSILGFDNSFISTTTLPAITTISHQYQQLGKAAVGFVNTMITDNSDENHKHIDLSMLMIERDSCKKI